MIVPEHKLPIVQQCELIALAPSTFYYKPEPISVDDLNRNRRRADCNRIESTVTQ